ncbi:MAG: nucleotidyltransferase domain-containing protein [Desulfurococcales archaeon]|nr:nucleotidyltransferase domain-containing protein [Desulfurococcales archaeon]
MNKLSRKIINIIIEKFRENKDVVGIVVYGSIGRGDDDVYSDIDMIIYLKENNKNEILSKLVETLSSIENSLYNFVLKDKYIFVLEDKKIWIETRINNYNNIKNDVIYIIQSRIKDPKNAVVYDPYSVILPLIKMHWFTMDDEKIYNKEIDNLIHGLLYYLHLYAHYASHRKDWFRAYMNYTIALYKLAGLTAAAYGEKYNLYGPWFLLERIVKDNSIVNDFRKLTLMRENNLKLTILEINNYLNKLVEIEEV